MIRTTGETLALMSAEPVFPVQKLPFDVRRQILIEALEPDKPFELWEFMRPEVGANTAPDPRLNILFTSEQMLEEGAKLFRDNIPFMLNLGHAAVSEALAGGTPQDITGDDDKSNLWTCLRSFRTVILNLGATTSNGLHRADSPKPDLELMTNNMRAALRPLCRRAIEDGRVKRVIVRFNFTQISEHLGYVRFLAVLELWMRSSAMISIECHSDVSDVSFEQASHLQQNLYWSGLRIRLKDRIEMVVEDSARAAFVATTESHDRQEDSTWAATTESDDQQERTTSTEPRFEWNPASSLHWAFRGPLSSPVRPGW